MTRGGTLYRVGKGIDDQVLDPDGAGGSERGTDGERRAISQKTTEKRDSVERWECVVDRDTAYCEIHRLIEHYRAMPLQDLMAMANKGVAESEVFAQGELITLSVDIRRASDRSVRINVSAYGNNWWRHESIDESVLVEGS